MIKNFFVWGCLAALSMYGCSKKDAGTIEPNFVTKSSTASYRGYAMKGADLEYSVSIPIDTANRMIQSYLTSINYPSNDSGLRSLSFNADTLRAYLLNSEISEISFMLAHQPGYINSGHFGEPANTNPTALTLILVGKSTNGTYIHNSFGEVYEHFQPCPTYCNSAYEDPYVH